MKMRYAITAAFLVALGAAGYAAHRNRTSLALAHYAAGKAGTCGLLESLAGGRTLQEQIDNVERIRLSARVIRQDGRYALYATPEGEWWMPAGSGKALVYDLAEQRRKIYGSGIRPGDIVLDAGANVGVFTRRAVQAGAAKVVAIEPAPENLECLRRNLSAEIEAGRVMVVPKGVWDKVDVLRLSTDPANSARDSFVHPIEGGESVEVPLTTVDLLVEELGLGRVDFIKMDIEGAEERAIEGARHTLRRHRPRMALCLYHGPEDAVRVPRKVRQIEPAYTMRHACFCTEERVQAEVGFFE